MYILRLSNIYEIFFERDEKETNVPFYACSYKRPRETRMR